MKATMNIKEQDGEGKEYSFQIPVDKTFGHNAEIVEHIVPT